MLFQLIILLSCIFHNTISTLDLGNQFGGYSNYRPRYPAPSTSPIQTGGRKVTVQVYYESLCPDCQDFITGVFSETINDLGEYLDIYLYPYGNAQTIPTGYGSYEFISQHGPEETYGNMLHACGLQDLQNQTLAVQFNACLMDSSHAGKGSDDAAANICGLLLNVNANAIKQCANDGRGSLLLKYYGDESKKIGFKTVPTILINGVQSSSERFIIDVYMALGNIYNKNL